MICVIRIRGQVGLNKNIKETLNRLRLKKKYSCIVLHKPTKEKLGMIKKIENFVAFGEIDKETYKLLIEKRGKSINKSVPLKIDKILEGFEKGKTDEELNLKAYFRLHPPRGGIEAKKHFKVGKGVLGNNKKEINKLIKRML